MTFIKILVQIQIIVFMFHTYRLINETKDAVEKMYSSNQGTLNLDLNLSLPNLSCLAESLFSEQQISCLQN